jgi:hypothetical protein
MQLQPCELNLCIRFGLKFAILGIVDQKKMTNPAVNRYCKTLFVLLYIDIFPIYNFGEHLIC